jgi:hypothetical protein
MSETGTRPGARRGAVAGPHDGVLIQFSLATGGTRHETKPSGPHRRLSPQPAGGRWRKPGSSGCALPASGARAAVVPARPVTPVVEGQGAGEKGGELTGPKRVDRGKYGAKIHLLIERTGLPPVSRCLGRRSTRAKPVSRLCRGYRRSGPGAAGGAADRASSMVTSATTTTTCGAGCAAVASHRVSPATGRTPASGSAGTAGQSNARWPGSHDVGVCTAAMSAQPVTSWPSPTSPARSPATADSWREAALRHHGRPSDPADTHIRHPR